MSKAVEPALTHCGCVTWTLLADGRCRCECGVNIIAPGGAVPNLKVEPALTHLAKITALANSQLPDDDRRKITRTWVNWLREEADALQRNGAGAGALMATEIADALDSYLPPEPSSDHFHDDV